jgi:acyl-CoA thioester hydrolase
MKTHHESLAEFPVAVTIPVLFGDQDAFGHVNNTVYLRWCETARVEYLVRMGMWPKLPPEEVGPILASLTCDYKRPVTYPDTLYVGARVTRIGNSSFRMEHRVVSKALDMVVAHSVTTIVTVDYSRGKPVRVPEECRKAIERIEGKSFEAHIG